MPENNIETKFDDLQELLKCCDGTLDGLDRLRDQLVKIIEAKNKLSDSASKNAVFNQAQEVVSSVANLKEINSELPSAISEMKQLCQQALLLSQQFNSHPAVTFGQNNADVSGSEGNRKDEKDEKVPKASDQGDKGQ
jgi:hypothetical protein